MPRPVRPWFRVYVEICRDPKVRRLTPEQRWIWLSIMSAARESPESGSLFVAPGIPFTTKELADYAGVKEREVRNVLPVMESLSMIEIAVNGLVRVTNWSQRQFESDDVTKRTRDHRERSGEQRRNVPGNVPETETETETEEDTSAKPPQTPIRDDVERLCNRLADRIAADGSKRPTITKAWRDAARLMLDKDGRTEAEAAQAIDWCQAHHFWRSNILSMPKLREKYDQLRKVATAERRPDRRQAETDAIFDEAIARGHS
jgi:hypothetical protein